MELYRSSSYLFPILFRFILKVAKDEDDDNIVSMADVKTIFKDLDNDGDGNVELDEFLVNKILVWERCQSDAFDSTEILG